MTLPDEFMHDPEVVAALPALNEALEAALITRGADVKTLVVLVHTTSEQNGGAVLGCDCAGCKVALHKTFLQVLPASARITPPPSQFKKNTKAVH